MKTEHKISAGAVARTIVLLLALVNQCLGLAGVQVIPIGDETVNALVSTVWTVAAALAAWWKNNSFTGPAIEADKTLKRLKGE